MSDPVPVFINGRIQVRFFIVVRIRIRIKSIRIRNSGCKLQRRQGPVSFLYKYNIKQNQPEVFYTQ